MNDQRTFAMFRSLRPGVDGLHALDDPPDRCVCCSEPLAPTEGVAYAGGWAHGDCIDPPALCALCDGEEGDTEWSRFVPLGDAVAHAGCELDRDSDMVDAHMLGALR